MNFLATYFFEDVAVAAVTLAEAVGAIKRKCSKEKNMISVDLTKYDPLMGACGELACNVEK